MSAVASPRRYASSDARDLCGLLTCRVKRSLSRSVFTAPSLEHYKIDPSSLTESHAATIDYVMRPRPVECSAPLEARWRRARSTRAAGA